MLQTNLYDDKIYFAIKFQNNITEILEPQGWDKIESRMPRDPSWYGFWSDFIEDKYGMLFTYIRDKDITGGGEILRDIYDTPGQGSNAEVYFSFGIKKSNTRQEINSWRINLDEYTEDFGGVGTSIEKMPFQGKLRVRMSDNYTINGYQTMDGELLTPINTVSLRLHSKTLLEKTVASSIAPQTSNENGPTFFDTYLIVQPDQNNITINELTNVFTQPVAIIDSQSRTPAASGSPQPANGSGLDNQPFKDLISQYTPTTNGTLNVDWSGICGAFYYYNTFSNDDYWDITPRLVVQRLVGGVWTIITESDGTTSTITTGHGISPVPVSPITGTYPYSIATAGLSYILPSVTGSTPRHNVSKVEGFAFTELFQNIEVQRGDNVYLQLVMCPNSTVKVSASGWIQIDAFTNDIKYEQLTSTPSTQCSAYRYYDVFNQAIECITGQKNAISTSFFDSEPSTLAFGAKYLMTNGYSIRNFGANIHLPKISIQKLMQDTQAMFCLGFGIKRNPETGLERLAIGYVTDFFKTVSILTLTNTFEWKNKKSSKYCYSSAELGFNKYEGLNLIQQDETNTSASYLLQKTTYNNNVLSKKSDTISAGYLIEEQRRHQFELNPGQSLTNDEDIFIIPTSEPCIFSKDLRNNANFPLFINFGTYVDSFGKSFPRVGFSLTSMALLKGDTFVLDAGLNAGTVFTIIGEVDGYPTIDSDLYDISPTPITELAVTGANVTIYPSSPNQVFAERNQPFKICKNVIDPTTIYGGRLTPAHLLYAWRPVLGVGLDQSDVDSIDYSVSQIVPTLVKMNSLFTTQFLPTEQFKGNVGDQILVENNRIKIKDYLKNGRNIFSSTGATFKAKIGYNEYNEIRLALTGESSDSEKNFGGITANDDVNNLWFCHIMDFRYNFVSEVASFDVQLVSKVAISGS